MKRYQVLIVDDENLPRKYFKLIIDGSDDYALAGELATATLAKKFCDTTKVDLVLMDVVMKDGYDGLAAAAEIKKEHPDVKILVVTSMPESSYLDRAREIGIDSFWYKEIEDKPLLNVITRTMNGEHIYPDTALVVSIGEAESSDFTTREMEVLRELVNGYTNQEIGEHLGVSVNTVRVHIATLLKKTGCVSRTNLAITAVRSGIVSVYE